MTDNATAPGAGRYQPYRPSRAALQRARDLSNATTEQWFEGVLLQPPLLALARVLQEHSNVAEGCLNAPPLGPWRGMLLKSLILPDQPEPLADLRAVLNEMYGELPKGTWPDCLIDRVSEGLAKRGKALKIVEAGDA